jgi:exodeoxyribonuclease VII small subunit
MIDSKEDRMGSTASNGSAQACDEFSFEQSLGELESIVHDLEDGQLGLAEALARYEQGVQHLKHCYQLLEQAERKIELLTGVAEDGTAFTEPFHESAEPLADSTGRRRRSKLSQAAPNGDAANHDIDA